MRANFRQSANQTEYFDLFLDPKTGENEFDFEPQNPALEGYYYPVRINDVYGLQIDCSVKNLSEAQDVTSFADIKIEIENKIASDHLTIGYTWLVSGWLREEDSQNAATIAQACYEVLFPENNWRTGIYSEGDFLNGKFFEIWQRESKVQQHVVFLLFPNKDMAIKGAEFYSDWMGLFCYRHKITWAYQQSRTIKASLVNHYRKVDVNAKIIKQNQYNIQASNNNAKGSLDEIQGILDQYTIDLLKLTFQKQIIEINLENYQRRVELIKQKLSEVESELKNNLGKLSIFDNLVENKYLSQIDKDNDNMQLGIKLLENKINATNSKIEIEKGERDRNFQNIITFIGTGMAGTKLIESSQKTCEIFYDKESTTCENPTSRISITVGLILICGLLGWLFKYLIKKL
ncbi:hypothetical protein [Xenococcus sp. PCC 7305]|uniref:hypothetical protein n=1 Tax=Xenococcus sp. PCC 7305 TaxID=102125 RepID=UPI0011819375|nr:hypothetical protein [Xenococcus sp. PCC 7305]